MSTAARTAATAAAFSTAAHEGTEDAPPTQAPWRVPDRFIGVEFGALDPQRALALPNLERLLQATAAEMIARGGATRQTMSQPQKLAPGSSSTRVFVRTCALPKTNRLLRQPLEACARTHPENLRLFSDAGPHCDKLGGGGGW